MRAQPAEVTSLPFNANRDQIGREIHHQHMLEPQSQRDDRYAKLYAAYQLEWGAFSRETSRWRLLKEEEQPNLSSVHEAELRAKSAQDRYRRARNRLSEHIIELMKHPAMKSLVAH